MLIIQILEEMSQSDTNEATTPDRLRRSVRNSNTSSSDFITGEVPILEEINRTSKSEHSGGLVLLPV